MLRSNAEFRQMAEVFTQSVMWTLQNTHIAEWDITEAKYPEH